MRVADLIPSAARKAYPAWLGQALQPRRHIHAVTVDVVILDDDVADIDSHAINNAAIVWHRRAVLSVAN